MLQLRRPLWPITAHISAVKIEGREDKIQHETLSTDCKLDECCRNVRVRNVCQWSKRLYGEWGKTCSSGLK